MKATIIIPAFLISFNLIAQKPPLKFGDVSLDELKMSIYEKDSSAEAVVLADYGSSQITFNQTKGFELRFERVKRIKIITKEGYKWANMTIPIYKRDNLDEKLVGLKGVTFNLENNKIVESKLEKEGIFREAASENWDLVKLTMPNVREGSIIDITYRVTSPYLFNFQDWAFQSTIPTKWSEYAAYIPEYFEYQRFVQGYIAFKESSQTSLKRSISINTKERSSGGLDSSPTTFSSQNIDYQENLFRWVAEDVPAFKEEPFMTTYKDYISEINFELALVKMPGRPIETVMGTWDNINKELLDANEFGGVVKRSSYLNRSVEEIVAGKQDQSSKMISIYDFLRSNVEWNGVHGMYSHGDFKKVLDEKRGSCADINLLLVSMLQKASLKAEPVVLSTRDHGFIRKQFPLSSQFNYVICAVNIDNKLYLLDATDRSLPIYMLPERCLNGSGFIVSESKPGWVELVPSVKSRIVTDATINFNEEGMKAMVKLSKEGYDAHRMRLDYYAKGESDYVKNLSLRSGWTILSSKFENIANPNAVVSEFYEVSFSEGETMADIIYMNPSIGAEVRENPFKTEQRQYPVDFGSPFERTNLIKIMVPSGYTVEDMPKPTAISLPGGGGRFIYNINHINGSISITTQLIISKSLYDQMEYQNLREFYSQMVAKNDEQIVIKKSN